MLPNLPFLDLTRWFSLQKDENNSLRSSISLNPAVADCDGNGLGEEQQQTEKFDEGSMVPDDSMRDKVAAARMLLKEGYNTEVEVIRKTEYPYLRGS